MPHDQMWKQYRLDGLRRMLPRLIAEAADAQRSEPTKARCLEEAIDDLHVLIARLSNATDDSTNDEASEAAHYPMGARGA